MIFRHTRGCSRTHPTYSTTLSSLVAPQVVITISGAARGSRLGFIEALNFQCSCICISAYLRFKSYCFSDINIQCAYDLSISRAHLSPQNSVRCSIARSVVRGGMGCILWEMGSDDSQTTALVFVLPLFCSISYYIDHAISKACSNYISEMNISHIS